jgi:hypothetical protein
MAGPKESRLAEILHLARDRERPLAVAPERVQVDHPDRGDALGLVLQVVVDVGIDPAFDDQSFALDARREDLPDAVQGGVGLDEGLIEQHGLADARRNPLPLGRDRSRRHGDADQKPIRPKLHEPHLRGDCPIVGERR